MNVFSIIPLDGMGYGSKQHHVSAVNAVNSNFQNQMQPHSQGNAETARYKNI